MQSYQITQAIKHQLKINKITYQDVAHELGLSESAVKQMFASNNFSLKRLDELCQILDIDLSMLAELVEDLHNKVSQLTLQQERQLVADQKLLLLAYLLVNNLTIKEIIETYNFETQELAEKLYILEQIGFIDRLPNNRVKLLISKHFEWIKNGPIESYFQKQVQSEFFDSEFSEDNELIIMKNANLSTKSQLEIHSKIKAISQHFDDCVAQEKKLPMDKKYGVSMVLAIREWKFQAFEKYRK